MENKYYTLQGELYKLAHRLETWFDIDKVKDYAVYVWTKDSGDETVEEMDGECVFDILEDSIAFYPCKKSYDLPAEAMPIIGAIQSKLREIRLVTKEMEANATIGE